MNAFISRFIRSKQSVVHKIMKSKGAFMSFYMSIVNIRELGKSKPAVSKKLQEFAVFFFDSKSIMKIFMIDRILTTLNKTSRILQSSNFRIVELMPVIDSCCNSLEQMNSTEMINESKEFVNSVRSRRKSDR